MYNPYYVLTIQRPSQQPENRSLNQPVVTIGRNAGDISLGDPLSSGRHAEIYFQNGQVYVRDVGSTNGTYFNGMRMPEFGLQPGQSFQCGQTILTLMGIYGTAPQPQQPTYNTNPALAATVAAVPAVQAQAAAAYAAQAGMQQGYGQGYPQAVPPPPMVAPPQAQPQPVYPPQSYGQPQPSPYPAQAAYSPQPQSQPQPQAAYSPQPQASYPQQSPQQAMVPVGSTSPLQPGAQPQAMVPSQGMVGGVRVTVTLTGGDLIGKMLLGYILCAITFGIYVPWFICSLQRQILSKASIGPTRRGNVRLAFTGSGGKLFVTGLVGYLLTLITFGIYAPWFLSSLLKFFLSNTTGTADDGTQISLRFDGTGGHLFVPVWVGIVLCSITFGIYTPWFLCGVMRAIYANTRICENGQPIGQFEFSGTGGKLFGTYLVGAILTMITFGIYFSWFAVKLQRFFAQNTRVEYHGHRFVGEFTGGGLDLFLIVLVGWLLLPITLGIYIFWYLAKLIRFQANNLVFHQMS